MKLKVHLFKFDRLKLALGITLISSLALVLFILLYLRNIEEIVYHKPKCIELYFNEYNFYKKNLSQEEQIFKNNLKNFYSQIYEGSILDRLINFINESSLRSEDYLAYYNPLKERKILDFKKSGKNEYTAIVESKINYNTEFTSPKISDIIEKYKVQNYKQPEFSAKISEIESKNIVAFFTLTSKTEVHFFLNSSEAKIRDIKFNIICSEINNVK